MNILEYRAMIAQEEQEKNQPVTEEVVVPDVAPVVEEPTPIQPEEEAVPQTFDVNGEQVTLDELTKGYLRQSDYTRKTQDISRQSREIEKARELLEKVSENPELAQQLGYDPESERVRELEANYYDLLLEKEVMTLSNKYADFDTDNVLNFAVERQMDNLEDAYLLYKQYNPNQAQPNSSVPNTQAIDVEALKAQIRAELQAEQNTSTIITGGGQAPTPQAEITLSPAEQRIARGMGLSDAEYAKWR